MDLVGREPGGREAAERVCVGLVATFKAIHNDMSHLPYAGALIASSALLLTAWGAFVWFNRAAEELEPEAMEKAKEEDEKLAE